MMKRVLLLLFVLCITPGLYSQDYSLKQLENSPRHHEWVNIQNGDRTIRAFVSFPEISEKALSVIIIHENQGLTPWVRSFADQLSAAGYLCIAPDMLSGFSKEYKNTSDFPGTDEARQAIYQLDGKQVMSDISAVSKYISSHPAASGKSVVAGFCWGGSQSFRFACEDSDISAVFVFYGSAPADSALIAKIQVPVYGFYGENDERINSGIQSAYDLMNNYGKKYCYEIYEGAGHAFMRRGEDPESDQANKSARNTSFQRLNEILSGLK